MKVSHISGIRFPEFAEEGNIAFTLCDWVLQYPEYAKFYKKLTMYKILDNCAAENGQSSPYEQVIQAARMVNANEIWISDKLCDCEQTLKMTREFLGTLTLAERKHYNLVGIPQGRTLKEWLKCYDFMSNCDDISVIGLSKYSVPECFYELCKTKSIADSRIFAVKWLSRNRTVKKLHHLCGADNNIVMEIVNAQKFSFVRSIDSNIAFKMAVHGLDIKKVNYEPEKRLNHDIKRISKSQRMLVHKNIHYINSFL